MIRTILSTLAVAAALLMSAAPPAASQGASKQEMEYMKHEKWGSRRSGWGSGNYNAQYASPNAAGKKGPKFQTDTTKPKAKRQAR